MKLIKELDILGSDICVILPRDASRCVQSFEARSPRHVWADRRPHLRRPQADGLLCVSLLPLLFIAHILYAVHAVLKETLRIFPSAPLVGRTSRDDPLVIPSTNNLYLPPKTQIMMTSLLAHKRADLWGPDAEVFRPERWFEPALLDKVSKTPFMYSPFYGGPRAVSTPSSLYV